MHVKSYFENLRKGWRERQRLIAHRNAPPPAYDKSYWDKQRGQTKALQPPMGVNRLAYSDKSTVQDRHGKPRNLGGVSDMGRAFREGQRTKIRAGSRQYGDAYWKAKLIARNTLAEMKAMPKPVLKSLRSQQPKLGKSSSVMGYTATGKPTYQVGTMRHAIDLHPEFTAQDHLDMARQFKHQATQSFGKDDLAHKHLSHQAAMHSLAAIARGPKPSGSAGKLT